MTASASGAWFALHIAPSPQALERVERHVAALGFEAWAPRSKRLVKRPNRGRIDPARRTKSAYVKVVIVQPILPRYVFVRLPAIDTPFGLLSQPEAKYAGIGKIVGTADGPLEIPVAVVNALRKREAEGEFDGTTRRHRRIVAKPADWLVPGVSVLMRSGPFADFIGTLEKLVGPDRAKISVNLFGRETVVDAEIEQIGQALSVR